MNVSSFSSKSSVFYSMQSAHYSQKVSRGLGQWPKGAEAPSCFWVVSQEPRFSGDAVPLLPATEELAGALVSCSALMCPVLPTSVASATLSPRHRHTSGSASRWDCNPLFLYGLALARQSPLTSNVSIITFEKESLLPALGEACAG